MVFEDSQIVESREFSRHCSGCGALVKGYFQKKTTAIGQVGRGLLENTAVESQAVESAIEGAGRLKIANRAIQRLYLPGGNIGGIRHNYLKWQGVYQF